MLVAVVAVCCANGGAHGQKWRDAGGAAVFAARGTAIAPGDSPTSATASELDAPAAIDLGALGVSPSPMPAALDEQSFVPLSAATGPGRMFLATTHGIVDQNTSNAFGLVSAYWSIAEVVSVYTNGVLSTFRADSLGRFAVSFSTGAGYGYVTIEVIGNTSHKRAAAVVQVAPAGPYLPGFAAAPHALYPPYSSFVLLGDGYPKNATVNLYRNGVVLASVSTGAAGEFYVAVTPGATEDTAAVYSADVPGTAATMAGMSVEERHDAGTSNILIGGFGTVRALVDRPVLDSASGGTVALSGEGFISGEIVDVTGCALGSVAVDGNGAFESFLSFGPSPGTAVAICKLTGRMSSRMAWAAVVEHPDVSNIRSMIVAPSNAGPGGTITVLADRLPPNDPTTVSVDGAPRTVTATDSDGRLSAVLAKPAAGLTHAISLTGSGGAQSTVFLLRRGTRDDVDRDVRTDLTVFRPSNGVWYAALSSGGATATYWGTATDVDVLGDYDGDGKADVAVWRPSTGIWYIVQSADGSVRAAAWGTNGDIPLVGDVDGDLKDDLVVYRPSTATWFFNKSTGGTSVFTWGISGDAPLLGDYDGDGKMDATVFRPSSSAWYSTLSAGGTMIRPFGATGDIPVVGDFDADSTADVAVFRPSTGQWFVRNVFTQRGYDVVNWGMAGDVPLSGDWDGDGKNDFTIWRNGGYYTLQSSGGVVITPWGIGGDRPSGRQPGT